MAPDSACFPDGTAKCSADLDCGGNKLATVCINEQCAVPCVDEDGDADLSFCDLGEACKPGESSAGLTYYCDPIGFEMDLNLLDACVAHFVDGLAPNLQTGDVCSMEARLALMLDQTGDGSFNIYDVDQCVRSYLQQIPCTEGDNEAPGTCPGGGVWCVDDSRCGNGSYCNTWLRRCVRECGYIANREVSGPDLLDRRCATALSWCNYERGQCEVVYKPGDLCDSEGACDHGECIEGECRLLCQVDSDCPAGAYCDLGLCAANCFRTSDCPGSDWYCDERNRCQVRPISAPPEGFSFDPQRYVVRFASDEISLSPIETASEAPVVIMDMESGLQVFDNPAVGFGYRLELGDVTKLDLRCGDELTAQLAILDEVEDQVQRDAINRLKQECRPEQFFRLQSPYGTVNAVASNAIGVEIDETRAQELTPGLYSAVLQAYFDNGDITFARVVYIAPGPSGDYIGQLRLYMAQPENELGTTTFTSQLYVDTEGEPTSWHQLLMDEGLAKPETQCATDPTNEACVALFEEDVIDYTPGYNVYGYIDANQTLVFNRPQAQNKGENRIPVRGIYVPSQQHMRLVGLIDAGEEDCRSDEGSCVGASEEAFKVSNPFARHVRRLFFFYGPYERATSRFHGFYRETITGLAPYPVTVSGTFGITQVTPTNDPIELEDAIVPSERKRVAEFPTQLEKEVVDVDLARYCTPCELETLGFKETDEADRDYWLDPDELLANICPDTDADGYCDLLEHEEHDPEEEESAECREDPKENTRRLRDVHQFSEALGLALDALEAGDDGTERALSIYDFLRGQIRFCEDLTADERQDGMVCVDESAAQCGLAMFRKALLFERDNLAALAPGCSDAEQSEDTTCENPGYTLFCRRDLGSGCNYPPAENELLFLLQRHAAYYRELVQALKYEAGALQTDAFFTLYRNGIGDIEREEALSYKQLKLLEAWNTYEELRSYFFTAVATQVMIEWPMTAFAGLGQGWLDLMHNTAADRLALITDVVDLKRRLLMTAGETDFLFAQDLMHYEYLTQVLMMEVQRRWQQPVGQFRYAGQGPEAFEAGDTILARLNLQRNPLGLHPKQVYFESSDPTLSNWRNYKRAILNGPPGSGLLPDVESAVQVAVENLRASLQETRTLQEMIENAKLSYEDAVDSLCGPVVAMDKITPLCEPLSAEEWNDALSCSGSDCTYQYSCADDEDCTTVTLQYTAEEDDDADSDVTLDAACRLHTEQITIDDGGTERTCVRGQVGSLLQEREVLKLQRDQIERKMHVLQRQIATEVDYISFLGTEHQELKTALQNYRDATEELAIATEIANATADLTRISKDSIKECWMIAGFSVGTGCAAGGLSYAIGTAGVLAKWAALPRIRFLQRWEAYKQQLFEVDANHRQAIKQQQIALENLNLSVVSLLNEYEQVTQLIYNLNLRINDTVYLAKQAAKHYHARVDSAVDYMENHLTGAAVGNVLVRNEYVSRANQRFHGLLIATYKMASAFIHSYNREKDRTAILNQVFRLTTPDDVRELVGTLEVTEAEYCGAAGIDCDAENNTGYLRVSLRDLLFPQLVDITGASGEVLTRGQQFHNAITGPQYLRTRERGGRMVQQIEILFGVTLTDRGTTHDPSERWMISPLECNHIIVGRGNGTFAVNVIGNRLENLKYELWRGRTDRIRSCDPVERVEHDGNIVREYPINSYTVGYAPQSPDAALDNPPEFETHTSGLLACRNEPERGGTYVSEERCYNYFARDRSLAAPKLNLVIPIDAGFGNEWIVDDEVENPAVIEDIVLYFRYRTRPL
jgi:predicted  nucleic acid-binding Zn-ribbon protein